MKIELIRNFRNFLIEIEIGYLRLRLCFLSVGQGLMGLGRPLTQKTATELLILLFSFYAVDLLRLLVSALTLAYALFTSR
jgi:hypothetical protein